MKRKTHDEYVAEVKVIRDNIEVLGEYKNNKTKILHRCNIHDYEWLISPDNILSGRNCPKCANRFHRGHNDYIEELKIKNPNLEVLETFIGVDIGILHRCKIHDYVFKKTPSSALKGGGCIKCGSDKLAEQFSKTHEQYVEELKTINPNIEVVETYANAKTKILHRCKVDNYEWYTEPDHILHGSGCPKCACNILRSHDEYVSLLKEVNPNVVVIDKYINSQTKILHKCLIHDFEWSIIPNSVIAGHGCPKCGNNYRMSHKEYVDKVSNINSNIEVVGTFKNIKTKIPHKCLIHNYIWNAFPESILRGAGCIRCGADKSGEIRSYTHENYVKKLFDLNPDIIAIEEYINSSTNILHKCKKCNNVWSARPSNVLFGKGCPKCSISKGELEIAKWLDKHEVLYETQKRFEDCKDNRYLPFDFYLCDKNICIEYDGEQHYKSVDFFGGDNAFILRQKHDRIKNEYCKRNNIELVRIAYNENIEEKLNLLFTEI